jgi:hypothetical protein
MGILDFFSKKKLPSGDPVTQKAGIKLVNKNADKATRMAAADELANIGTPEAVFCLLQRFTMVIGGPTPDEDEKKHVWSIVVNTGKKAVEPIMKFLREKETVGQALEILKDITRETNYLDLLLELSELFDPYYSKYPDKKIQVFREISSFRDARIIDTLKPFLDDDDDDIRMAALAAITAQDDEETVREILIQTIIESYERPRIRLMACEAMASKQLNVKGYRKQIENVLPDNFYLNKKGQVLYR